MQTINNIQQKQTMHRATTLWSVGLCDNGISAFSYNNEPKQSGSET